MTALPHVYAHRGSSAALPEHTLAAYLRALDDGADGVDGAARAGEAPAGERADPREPFVRGGVDGDPRR